MIEQLRILVVDDQPRARQSLKALVLTWLHLAEVTEAGTGVEAVQQAEQFRPHIVIMDARMPELGGVEATRLIKAKWPETHVIVLSLYPEYRADALAAGADAFVGKGEPPERLLKMLMAAASDKSN
ncbi:MAG: response regulator transcription factor [Chloroflexi bacterium]|nr:response regulator transcription factor [Chloroflexota bacterium]